jgi:RNA polymerase sigma-70 factor, ECF subfamily
VADPPITGQEPTPAGRYQPGSREDFDRLYEATYQRVFRTLLAALRNRAEAEDCTQETFVRAYQAWSRWREDAPVEAWLHRIAINVAISHRRRERLREAVSVLLHARPKEVDPTEMPANPDLIQELRRLPPKQSAALVLRHLHGFSNREIALAVGVPERTIASRLAAARGLLSRRLQNREREEVAILDASKEGW